MKSQRGKEDGNKGEYRGRGERERVVRIRGRDTQIGGKREIEERGQGGYQ